MPSNNNGAQSALVTALWFLPMPLTYLVLIPAVNALARRTGPRLPMTAGLTLMAAGMALYAAAGPQADVWLLELSFVLAGAGLALNTGPAVGLAMSAVPVQRAGLASGRGESGPAGGYHCRCRGVG